jgi:hypothetical protein
MQRKWMESKYPAERWLEITNQSSLPFRIDKIIATTNGRGEEV